MIEKIKQLYQGPVERFQDHQERIVSQPDIHLLPLSWKNYKEAFGRSQIRFLLPVIAQMGIENTVIFGGRNVPISTNIETIPTDGTWVVLYATSPAKDSDTIV